MKRYLLHERSALYAPLALYLKTPQAIGTLNKPGTNQMTTITAEDILVLEAEFLPLENAIDLHEKFPNNLIYYLFLHPDEEHITQSEYIFRIATAKEAGLQVIPAHYTMDQIFQRLFTQQLRMKKVIAVAGALPQAGVTTIALNLAGAISRTSNAKVGVLGLNAFGPDREYHAYEGKNLTEIWTDVQSRKLNGMSLVREMHAVSSNLHVLASSSNPMNATRYSEEAALHLIKCATDAFDIVVLDVGSIFTTALAVQGLILADTIFFVTTQQIMAQAAALESIKMINELIGVSTDEFLLILNKAENRSEYATGKSIAIHLSMTYLTDIKFQPMIPVEQLQKRSTECLDVSSLADHVVDAFGLNKSLFKKKGWF